MNNGIKTAKVNGLTVYQVVIKGTVMNTYLSEAAAKSYILRLVNSLNK